MRAGAGTKAVGLVLAGVLVGMLMVSPAGAHISDSPDHLWTQHIRELAKDIFFTKTQSDGRYVKKGAAVKAPNFTYSTARTGFIFVQSASCQRGGDDIAPFADTKVHNWPGNSYSPGISTSATSGIVSWYCPVDIPRPPGATIRFTSGQFAYYDVQTNCVVGAEVVTKEFGGFGFDASVHKVRGAVYSGTNATDRAAVLPNDNPAVKPFTFTGDAAARTFAPGDIAWVNPFVDMTAGNSCRFIGMKISYTVDRP